MTFDNVVVIAPLIAAILVAAAILIVDFIAPGRDGPATVVAIGGLVIVMATVVVTGRTEATAFDGAYTVDALTTYLDLLFVTVVALTILFGPEYLGPRDMPLAEFAAVLVFAMSGAMLIAGSTDLLLLFLGLELMVLPGYLLAGFAKRDALSTEGAIKYFLLGSFSSAIFLFGLAYVWGLTGTTRVDGVADSLRSMVAGGSIAPGLALGLAFMTTGVAFKIAAVPFHYWTPDAYQGSPTPVTGYLSVGPKIGAFALILRLFVEALGPVSGQWLDVIIVLSALTMTLGNLVALTQTNVKRMLAYSSIAHTGYMLMGLAAYAAGQVDGLVGLLYYGAAYAFMNLGAFAVVAALQRRQGVTSSLDTFAGLGRREPFLAILMTLFLLSLTGIPPTAGFFGKALVILSAVEAGGPLTWLAVIAVINAAIAAFYYLRVVVYMFMREPGVIITPSRGTLLRGGLVVAMVGTVLLGVWPIPVLDAARAAAEAIDLATLGLEGRRDQPQERGRPTRPIDDQVRRSGQGGVEQPAMRHRDGESRPKLPGRHSSMGRLEGFHVRCVVPEHDRRRGDEVRQEPLEGGALGPGDVRLELDDEALIDATEACAEAGGKSPFDGRIELLASRVTVGRGPVVEADRWSLRLDEEPGRRTAGDLGEGRDDAIAESGRRLDEWRQPVGQLDAEGLGRPAPSEVAAFVAVVAEVADATDPDAADEIRRGTAREDDDGEALRMDRRMTSEAPQDGPDAGSEERAHRVGVVVGERPVEVGDDEQPAWDGDDGPDHGRDLTRRSGRGDGRGHGVTSTPGRIVSRFVAMMSGPIPPRAPARMMPVASIQKWTGRA